MSNLKECEVKIRLEIPKSKMKDLYAAIDALSKIGVICDTGGTCTDPVLYDLEFDWSLKGAKVFFKRFKNEETE